MKKSLSLSKTRLQRERRKREELLQHKKFKPCAKTISSSCMSSLCSSFEGHVRENAEEKLSRYKNALSIIGATVCLARTQTWGGPRGTFHESCSGGAWPHACSQKSGCRACTGTERRRHRRCQGKEMRTRLRAGSWWGTEAGTEVAGRGPGRKLDGGWTNED